MRTITLGDWSRYYPDGVSRIAYARLNRLILRLGTTATIRITPGCHDSLRAALDKLEK